MDIFTLRKIKQVYSRAFAYRHFAVVIVIATTVFMVLTYLFIKQHRAYMTTGSDLGAYVHMFSTTLSGEGWLQHGKHRVGHPQGSYWGAHFSLTLLLFLPVFALHQDPVTLIVIKSVVLTGSVILLWFVARSAIEHRSLALAVVLSYALNPFLWRAWLFDFQEQILIPVFVFLSYYAYERHRYGLFLVTIGLLVFTNEFLVPLVVGYLFGLGVLAYREGRYAHERGVLLGGFGLAVVAMVLANYVMSQFSVAAGIPIRSIAEPADAYTDQWRLSMTELLTLFFTNPDLMVEAFMYDISTKATFLVLLFAPILFLSLLDESAVAATAPFFGFAWLFAGQSLYYEFAAHYPLYLLPFLYIGTVRVLGSGRVTVVSSINWRILITGVVAINLLVGLAVAPVSDRPDHDDRSDQLNEAIETIPEEASLLTQNDIYPHVATRSDASYVTRVEMFQEYDHRYGPVEPDYILLDGNSNWATEVFDGFGDRLYEEYGVYRFEEGVFVFKRGYDSAPKGITDEFDISERYQPDDLSTGSGERSDGHMFSTVSAQNDQRVTVWYGPYEALPPGIYEVTFVINVPVDATVQLDVAVGDDPDVLETEKVEETDGFQTVTITFELERAVLDAEYRGFQTAGDGTTELRNIMVEHRGQPEEDCRE